MDLLNKLLTVNSALCGVQQTMMKATIELVTITVDASLGFNFSLILVIVSVTFTNRLKYHFKYHHSYFMALAQVLKNIPAKI